MINLLFIFQNKLQYNIYDAQRKLFLFTRTDGPLLIGSNPASKQTGLWKQLQ